MTGPTLLTPDNRMDGNEPLSEIPVVTVSQFHNQLANADRIEIDSVTKVKGNDPIVVMPDGYQFIDWSKITY